jgi:hypothetical protein
MLRYPIPTTAPYLDPVTGEWVFPDGTRLPRLAGAAPDDDISVEDDDPEPPAGEVDDPDDEDEEEDDWHPPSRGDWAKMQDALKTYKRDLRKQRREYEDQISNISTEGTAAAQVEIEKARIEATQKEEKRWMKKVVKAEAAKLLVDAGANASTADRLARLVDLEKISYDDRSEELVGLDEEIDDLVAEHPDFFESKEKQERSQPVRRERPRVDGATRGSRGGSGAAPPRKRTSADVIAAGVLGRQGRRPRR